jgi:hypothetical protein
VQALSLTRWHHGAGRVVLMLLRDFGPVGLVALALMLASAVVAFVLTPRLHDRSIALDEALQAASLRRAAPVRRDADSDAAGFTASLPAIASNAADMNRLFEIASASNIKTPKADYRLSAISSSLFLAYEVRIPVSASYVDVRRFTADALSQLPNLALDGVRFSRLDSTSEALDAELRLVLFYRKQAP